MDTQRFRQTKVVTPEQLCRVREEARTRGDVVVQCHGCFDIVHPGHVRHLQHASEQGDVLVVSLTPDEHLGKGEGRPLFTQELRAENLAALDCVDWVCVNSEATATRLLSRVQPDVYIKGKEYEQNQDPRFKAERDAVEAHGGRVLFSSGDIVFSSTALVQAMEDREDPLHAGLKRLCESNNLTGERLEPLIDSFAGRRVCVVGETIIDTYVYCDRPEVAGESPVMSLRPLERTSFDGGAAVIARHLAGMGARPVLVTALPRTPEAQALRERLESQGIEVAWQECRGPMLEKQRFLVGSQKVMKLDLVRPLTIDAASRDGVQSTVEQACDGADACILADFGHGFLSSGLIARLSSALRGKVGVLAGDVSGRRSGLEQMLSMDLMCPTEAELRASMQDFDDSLNAVVARFMHRTGARNMLVTIGSDGVIAFARPEEDLRSWDTRLRSEHIPSIVTHASDELGCGDAMLAAGALALASGASLVDAAYLGSVAAGIQAQRIGNDAVNADMLRSRVRSVCSARLEVTNVARPVRAAV